MENICKRKGFEKVCKYAEKYDLECEAYVDGNIAQTNFFPTESTRIGMRCSRKFKTSTSNS